MKISLSKLPKTKAMVTAAKVLIFLFAAAVIACFCAAVSDAKSKYPEKHYQAIWCGKAGGEMEYRLQDGTRCDCLTDKFAVEIDFAPKWYNGFAQAMHYAMWTGKRPGLVLIVKSETDREKVVNAKRLSEYYGVNMVVWEMWGY